MKYVFGLIAFLVLLSFRPADGIYNFTLRDINGNKIELGLYKGKKMLFVVLPSSAQDTSIFIKDLSQFQTKYKNTLVVIGIPAEEYGFKKGDEDKIEQLYKNEVKNTAINFLIAERMKVKKGTEQSSLFQWLTSKDQNRHFDQDVRGVGSKFFVDEEGELYAVMSPKFSFTNPLIDKILAKQKGKKL